MKLELSVKSEAWWIQGWLFLASDSQYPAWEQRFLELEASCPEWLWWIRAYWFPVLWIQVWWSDPVWWFGLKFVRRLIQRWILRWMKSCRRRFRLLHWFRSAARPSLRRSGEASEKSVPAA